jgi:DNA-binding transcriptional ArsR family regulator
MKHLDVLEGAGLIARRKQGRTVTCRLTAAPMEDAMGWLVRYQRFWTESLDRLAQLVEEPK